MGAISVVQMSCAYFAGMGIYIRICAPIIGRITIRVGTIVRLNISAVISRITPHVHIGIGCKACYTNNHQNCQNCHCLFHFLFPFKYLVFINFFKSFRSIHISGRKSLTERFCWIFFNIAVIMFKNAVFQGI